MIVSSVVNVFDDTMNSVSAGSRSWVASQTSLPSTLDTNRNVRPRSLKSRQRFVGHGRTEVGAADADVDDVADALAGDAGPLAGAHPVGELGHPVEHGVDVGDDVLAVDHEVRVAGHAQRDVEDGAVLGDVDVLAAEHRVDAVPEPAPVGQCEQERASSRR